jgi:putative ABC transport system permease protein
VNVRESFRIAWRAIRSHPLRSTLTTLGVIIGIAAVITFVTLGAGLQQGILGDISPDDQQKVYVWAGPPEGGDQGPLAGAQPVFTQRDAEAVAELEDVEAAYVYSPIPAQSVDDGNQTIPRQDGFVATGREYLDPGAVAAGERFEMGEQEAVINPAMAGLFEQNVTVGSTLNVTVVGGLAVETTVVGITEDSSSRSPLEGFGPAPRMYLPNDPYFEQLSGAAAGGQRVRYVAMIAEAESKDAADIRATKDATGAYLESDRSDAGQRIREDDELTVIQRTSTELLSQLEDVLNLLQNFVVGIAGISLVVGSIGIANIMLVSVTERTREIGIMKAVGAQKRDVLVLFLIEAVLVGLIGAVFGTLLGIAAGYGIGEYVGIPYVFPTEWAAVAVVVGVLVGVLAGLYPAWNAARTDPIEALRYE